MANNFSRRHTARLDWRGKTIPAYVIADARVLDRDALATYRSLAASSIHLYGGRYRVRGGVTETLEGNWEPEYIAVLEFESMEKAHQWYKSPEYGEALKVRAVALERNLLFVEGWEE